MSRRNLVWPARNPSMLHSHTPGHLVMGETSSVQGPGPPRRPTPIIWRVGSSPKARPKYAQVPTTARARPGGRSVNTALVDSLARHAHPSAAWCSRPPSPALSPPTPLPHSAAPAGPRLRAQDRLPQRTPGRLQARRRAPTPQEAGPRRCPRPTGPGLAPSPGAKSSQVPPTRPGPPCATPGLPPRSQTHFPALGYSAPKQGRPHFSRTYLRVRPSRPARSLAALWRRPQGPRRPPCPAPPFSHLGPVAAGGRTRA